jgi:DNA invertase Pin-like site-specific DNA recombinase
MTASPQLACLYLRSSKDRHDLSIDAQRRALHDYAREQGMAVVAEYADAAEHGRDDDRPGFQALLTALRATGRPWGALLALDTSRIARRRHLALIFEHECSKASVRLCYQSVPDTDPITAMLLRSILQAMDEWHSLTSKAKGLAGMAEAVRQGWRAGGQAPRGYRLDHQSSGVMRDGQPVMRSRLQPTAEAPAIAAYLRARAAGQSRGLASQAAGITGDLNGLEWQALTYAGHTVWGMHHEHRPGGYVGGHKRRPRADWQVTRDTHEALISDAEAEAILAQLAARGGRRTRAGERLYLLSGLLQDPQGAAYAGETCKGQAFYRLGKGARIAARLVDGAVLDQVFADLAAPATASAIAASMRAQASPTHPPADPAALRRQLAALDAKISRLVALVAEDQEAAPAYRRAIAAMETDRARLAEDLATATSARQQANVIRAWTAGDVTKLLGELREALAADLAEERLGDVRQALHGLIERIVLDLPSRDWAIHYKLCAGVKVASPRGRPVAPVTWISRGRVARRRLA